MDWLQALYFFLLPSSRTLRLFRASRKIPRLPRLAHGVPVMQASNGEKDDKKKPRTLSAVNKRQRRGYSDHKHVQRQRQNTVITMQTKPMKFWNLFVYISFSFRGPCVRKLLNGLIMYIYPLKIKNIVLYCIEHRLQTRRQEVYSQNYVLRCNDRQQELHDL